jgi:hypothetical protein
MLGRHQPEIRHERRGQPTPVPQPKGPPDGEAECSSAANVLAKPAVDAATERVERLPKLLSLDNSRQGDAKAAR